MDMKGELLAGKWQKLFGGSKPLAAPWVAGEGQIHPCLEAALAVKINGKGQVPLRKTIY